MLWLRPGDLLPWEFAISHPVNGTSMNADELPAVSLALNGVIDTDVTVTVTQISTGRYLASCVIPETYAGGDCIALRAYALVATIPCRDVLYQARLMTIDFTQVAGVSLVVGAVGSQVLAAGEVSDGTPIVAYHGAPWEGGPIAVLDADNNPIDMSDYADDLAFVVFRLYQGDEELIGELYGEDVELVDGHNNQVWLHNTTQLNQTVGEFRYVLRRRTEGEKVVRAAGCYTVRACAVATEPD